MKKPTLRRKKKQVAEQPSRITNETVAEHREQILAGGRRFKYPRQIARHKLVFNAIIISIASLIILAIITWWQLYPVQNTSAFFYNVTRMLPLPVASVEGKQVLYSDYLLRLNGSTHYLEETERLNLDTEDGQRQVEFMKRQALDGAIADTYAEKIATERNISVSRKEVNDVIDSSLNTVNGRISQDVYDNSTFSTLGYDAEEYRHIIERSLQREKVAYAIDDTAAKAKAEAEVYISSSEKPSLGKLADQLEKNGYEIQTGSSGLVPKTNHDGGLSQTAYNLKEGALSQVVKSTTGDGYYILQLNSKNDRQLNYSFIKIPLTEFDKRIEALSKNDKISEYIDVAGNKATDVEQK